MQPRELRRLANLIRSERARLNMTIVDVAKLADVDRTTITRLENGQLESPRIKTVANVGRALSIPTADLFPTTDAYAANDLPSLTPYLRTKYANLSESDIEELDTFRKQLEARHGAQGPQNREDE